MRYIVKISSVVVVVFAAIFLFVFVDAIVGGDEESSFDRAVAAMRRENYPAAAMQFQSLSDQGSREAQFALATLYLEGKGVQQDYSRAINLFRQSAQQDDRNACYSLGIMYASGIGVAKDVEVATDWFRRAAELGHLRSQVVMASYYKNPGSTARDDVQAARWTFRASQQGSTDAQVNLAILYANGVGVPKDHVSAYAWATVASERADKEELRGQAIRAQDLLRQSMRPEEVIDAQKLALAWKPQPESAPVPPGRSRLEQGGVQALLSFEGNEAVVRWRLLQPVLADELTGDVDGRPFPVGDLSRVSYPTVGAKTSVVLLLDISDPGRQSSIDDAKRDIAEVARSVGSHHEVDVAVYANDLHLLQPKDRSVEAIEAVLTQTAPLAEPVRLGAVLKAAIEMPSVVPVERRGIFVFHDGHTDDTLDAKSLIDIAKRRNTSLNFVLSQGNRSIDPSVFATLADATGGRVVADAVALQSFLETPFWPLDSGGTIRAIIHPSPRLYWQPEPEARFVFHVGKNELVLKAAVPVPVAGVGETASRLVGERPYVAGGAGAALLILAGGMAFGIRRRRKKTLDVAPVIEEPPPRQALAVLHDEAGGATYPIQSRIVQLGRGNEAHVRLKDETVSRTHAILRQLKSGAFEIENRSGNGTFVNNQKVEIATLADGDLVTVGMTTLRYTQPELPGEAADAAPAAKAAEGVSQH